MLSVYFRGILESIEANLLCLNLLWSQVVNDAEEAAEEEPPVPPPPPPQSSKSKRGKGKKAAEAEAPQDAPRPKR